MYDLVVSNIYSPMAVFSRNELRVSIRVKFSENDIPRLDFFQNLYYLRTRHLECSRIIDDEHWPFEQLDVAKPCQELSLEFVEKFLHNYAYLI